MHSRIADWARLVRVALLPSAILVAATAAVLHQQHRLEARLDALTTGLDGLARRVADAGRAERTSASSPPVDVEGLAARVAQLTAPPPETPAAPAMPDAAQREAAESARQMIAQGIQRGQLSPDDVRDLRALLARAAPADTHELRRQLAVAINGGKLVPMDHASMLP